MYVFVARIKDECSINLNTQNNTECFNPVNYVLTDLDNWTVSNKAQNLISYFPLETSSVCAPQTKAKEMILCSYRSPSRGHLSRWRPHPTFRSNWVQEQRQSNNDGKPPSSSWDSYTTTSWTVMVDHRSWWCIVNQILMVDRGGSWSWTLIVDSGSRWWILTVDSGDGSWWWIVDRGGSWSWIVVVMVCDHGGSWSWIVVVMVCDHGGSWSWTLIVDRGSRWWILAVDSGDGSWWWIVVMDPDCG